VSIADGLDNLEAAGVGAKDDRLAAATDDLVARAGGEGGDDGEAGDADRRRKERVPGNGRGDRTADETRHDRSRERIEVPLIVSGPIEMATAPTGVRVILAVPGSSGQS
jgi:hypothetical protein